MIMPGFTPVENQKWSSLRAVPAPASLLDSAFSRWVGWGRINFGRASVKGLIFS